MNRETPPVALVTGAGKRIGATISRKLHQRGYRLALHYGRSEREATALAAELNGETADSAAIYQADLCDLASIDRMTDRLLAHWGRIDTVINNASMFYPTPLGESREWEWEELINSNLKGPYFLVSNLADALKQAGGTVVNIIDINARYPLKGYPIYCIAKAGKAMLTRTLARELAPEVRVNAVAPGSILWPEGEAAMSEEAKRALEKKIPLQRPGDPRDIAELACFLACSPGYLTGQVIAVDGGLSLVGDTS